MAHLAAVEGRLRAILEPYRDRLAASSIYGVETLTRTGVGAHDFFAGVKVGTSSVSLYLKPVYTWPALLEGISPELRRSMRGSQTAFSFGSVDEPLLAELEALVARSFAAYVGQTPSVARASR